MSCLVLRRIFTNRDHLFVIGSRTLHLVRSLGEGSYAVVYLVKDLSTNEFFALKKILSQDPDQLREAEWEIEILKSFQHPNILKLIDCEISPSRKIPNGKEILILTRFYEFTLQGEIDNLSVTNHHFSELQLLTLFLGICEGLSQFHTKQPIPWAHRDIKPNNILLSKDKIVVLADFGSVAPAHTEVKSRQQALKIQDDAQIYCTPQYRAPELFDVPSNCIIDERIDIWSLGCTLYCMVFLKSPFEDAIKSGSIALAVQNGKINIPAHHSYSEGVINLIMFMLNRSASQRPFIGDVIQHTKNLLTKQKT